VTSSAASETEDANARGRGDFLNLELINNNAFINSEKASASHFADFLHILNKWISQTAELRLRHLLLLKDQYLSLFVKTSGVAI
jgi:hypothetical protein